MIPQARPSPRAVFLLALAVGLGLGGARPAGGQPTPAEPGVGLQVGIVEQAVSGDGEPLPAALERELEAETEAEELALEAEQSDAFDPLEPMNRALFGVNRVVDRFVMNPLARAYGWLLPDAGKRAVERVFDNLNAPVVFVNDLLRLQPCRAGRTGARFLVNTTAGVGGIFDVATRVGLEGHSSDFGQTLGRAGVGAGAYLVLPLLGPSTVRDAVGQIVDGALRPYTWLLSPSGSLLLATTGGVSRREAYLVELDELERSSVDFYATLRSVYLMSREQAIQEEGR